ncbi:hypothetical protein NXS98_04380 [Fontisphaera persica]|uniref:hypothetical protein n=1 Tax=Fontisphaera persica TaxID=2974023 RepID=UPI0024C00098|nr:hypothetical protein [Fontisphaera persica]WCJ60374.1 hypothetical protein NXS98_04380 [Fontisphaera persica]
MKPSALFIIRGDPRVSHRPAEAIRIAAGVGTWKKTDITVYLHGPAVLALSEFVDELVDEDNYTRYLPILGEFGRPIYVQAGEPCLEAIEPATLPYEAIDEHRLAELAAAHSNVIYF